MGEKKEMRIPKISYRKFYPHLFSPEETTASEHVLTGKQMFFSTRAGVLETCLLCSFFRVLPTLLHLAALAHLAPVLSKQAVKLN